MNWILIKSDFILHIFFYSEVSLVQFAKLHVIDLKKKNNYVIY